MLPTSDIPTLRKSLEPLPDYVLELQNIAGNTVRHTRWISILADLRAAQAAFAEEVHQPTERKAKRPVLNMQDSDLDDAYDEEEDVYDSSGEEH